MTGGYVIFIYVASVLTCQEDFYLDEDLQSCIPSCPGWSQHDEVTRAAIQITIIISSTIGFVVAIAVLILSIIRRNSM